MSLMPDRKDKVDAVLARDNIALTTNTVIVLSCLAGLIMC